MLGAAILLVLVVNPTTCSPFPPSMMIGAASSISSVLTGVARLPTERVPTAAAAVVEARSITPSSSFTDLFGLQQRIASTSASSLSDASNVANNAAAGGEISSKLLKRPLKASSSNFFVQSPPTDLQQPPDLSLVDIDAAIKTADKHKKTRVASSAVDAEKVAAQEEFTAAQSAHSAVKVAVKEKPTPSEQAQLNLFTNLQNQMQAFMHSTGELVQKQASARASVFVGDRLRATSIKVATTLIESQYVNGVGFLAAQASRSLVTDNALVSTLLTDSIAKEAKKITEGVQSTISDKLKAELSQSGSILRGWKLISEGFGRDVLTKGTFDHFEQLCRLRQHANPQMKKFGKDVTQLVLFANPAVNPLVALSIIQFVCLTKTFPTTQVADAFPPALSFPRMPVFLESNKMAALGESAKRIIADNKADKLLAERLAFLPTQVKPPLKKWMSDAHMSMFDGLCSGLKSDNEYLRTLSMMVRNQIAGQSVAEAFTFKAFIDTTCFGTPSRS